MYKKQYSQNTIKLDILMNLKCAKHVGSDCTK